MDGTITNCHRASNSWASPSRDQIARSGGNFAQADRNSSTRITAVLLCHLSFEVWLITGPRRAHHSSTQSPIATTTGCFWQGSYSCVCVLSRLGVCGYKPESRICRVSATNGTSSLVCESQAAMIGPIRISLGNVNLQSVHCTWLSWLIAPSCPSPLAPHTASLEDSCSQVATHLCRSSESTLLTRVDRCPTCPLGRTPKPVHCSACSDFIHISYSFSHCSI